MKIVSIFLDNHGNGSSYPKGRVSMCA